MIEIFAPSVEIRGRRSDRAAAFQTAFLYLSINMHLVAISSRQNFKIQAQTDAYYKWYH
jgi:hypothetical protein